MSQYMIKNPTAAIHERNTEIARLRQELADAVAERRKLEDKAERDAMMLKAAVEDQQRMARQHEELMETVRDLRVQLSYAKEGSQTRQQEIELLNKELAKLHALSVKLSS